MLPVETPFKTYTDLSGKPLDQGYVYFGQPNQNPITNPVTVYWDAAGTIPAAQPLRTTNGYIMRAGTPANVFFDGAYSEMVLDKKKQQVFYARTSDEFSIAAVVSRFITSLAGAAGAALIGFKQIGSDYLRTLLSKGQERMSVEDFGPTGNGDDDTAVIQKAIDAADGELWFTKPAYRVDGPLVWKTGVIYRGRGVRIFGVGGTKITMNSTTDASKIVNPLNASNPVGIAFKDLYFYAPNLQQYNGVIFDTGTTYGLVQRCRFYSTGDGLILDQSELWDIEHTSFLIAGNNNPAGIWIVNGPDKQPNSQPYFTNRIGVRSCDFNGGPAATGIRDDGGVAHTFENNNFNNCGSHIIATGVTALKIDGGEYEGSAAQSIILGLVKRKGNAGAKSNAVSINRTYIYNDKNQPAVATVDGAVGKLEFTNNFLNTPSAPLSGLNTGCDEIMAYNNTQVGAGAGGPAINNHLDLVAAPCDWYASNTSPVLGNGQLVANYSRRGKLVTFRQRIVFGTTTTVGNGSYLFPLPFPVDTAAFAQMGSGYISQVGSSSYSATARITIDNQYVELFVNAPSDVGSSTPGGWAPNSVIEFQITYVAKLPI